MSTSRKQEIGFPHNASLNEAGSSENYDGRATKERWYHLNIGIWPRKLNSRFSSMAHAPSAKPFESASKDGTAAIGWNSWTTMIRALPHARRSRANGWMRRCTFASRTALGWLDSRDGERFC